MPKSTPKTDSGKAPNFDYLNELHLVGIEESVAAGKYVSAEDLSSALRKHGARPISPAVLDYLCNMLEGNVAKPKGRKGLPEFEARRWHMVIRGHYQNRRRWLEERKDRYGHPTGWTKLDGTAAEIAARIVAKRWLSGPDSWRTVQNIASSRK
jgi:hypothetical protein